MQLSEDSPSLALVVWVKLSVGQSCNSACAMQSRSCVESALSDLQTPQSLRTSAGKHFPCKVPILSGCGVDGGSFDPINGFCYFVDSECAQDNRPVSSVSCSSSHTEFERFCPCSLQTSTTITTSDSSTSSSNSGTNSNTGTSSHTGTGTSVNPGNSEDTEETDEEISSANSLRGAPLLILAALFGFLGKSKIAAVILAMLFGTQFAYGHNWLQSNSRASGASTVTPCPPSLSPMPHAQVGPGTFLQSAAIFDNLLQNSPSKSNG